MRTVDLISRLGLPPQAALLYRSLLKHGPMTVAALAKQTKLYRPVVYRYLPLLMSYDLVSESQIGKRVQYAAENPQALSGLLLELQNELADKLPVLLSQYERSGKRPVVRNYQGKHGIMHVYTELIRSAKKNDILYRYESPTDYTRLKKYYPALYREMAGGQSSKIQKFVITNEDTQARRRPRLERYSKALPAKQGSFIFDITQVILGNKVAFIDFKSETASLIESESFADFQRSIFKLLFYRI